VEPWAHEDEREAGEDGDSQAHGDEGLHRVVVVAAEDKAWLAWSPGSDRDPRRATTPPPASRFQERWRRFDEAIQALRALLHGDAGFQGKLYDTRGVVLEPRPAQSPGPPIWVASWGSPAGLRRVARLGDGWLASAYNTTPDSFREGLDRLAEELRRAGKAPEAFPSAVATTWLHITEDKGEAERVLSDVLTPTLHRPAEALRSAHC
jgi:alkanesulfonate monooxygenase SsuD/methylene tetrahydromethanopterin reductase-like flavin-dependent oxidoreductase (luciferase family)